MFSCIAAFHGLWIWLKKGICYAQIWERIQMLVTNRKSMNLPPREPDGGGKLSDVLDLLTKDQMEVLLCATEESQPVKSSHRKAAKTIAQSVLNIGNVPASHRLVWLLTSLKPNQFERKNLLSSRFELEVQRTGANSINYTSQTNLLSQHCLSNLGLPTQHCSMLKSIINRHTLSIFCIKLSLFNVTTHCLCW